MRILADENIPRAVVSGLREDGHDVLWIRELSPGISDDGVMELARVEQRIVVTFDKDFGELVVTSSRPLPPGVILVRISMRSPSSIAATISRILASRDDWVGHVAVIDDARIRMRPYQEAD